MKLSTLRVDLRVALLYALFGGLWILLSDRLLAALITDISLLTTMQTYKGWVYVAISALLIYFLLRRELAAQEIIENKLRESEERYRLLFETSIDAFLLTAPDGSIHAANPAACRMFGWPEEELKKIGRSGVVDENNPRLSTLLEERAREGYSRGELTFIRKDGTKFPGEISTAIFTNKQGSVQTSVVIRDITERVQAEEKLHDSQLRLAGIIDSAMDAIITLDENQRIILFNPAAENLFLCPADKAIGQFLDRFIPERFREAHREHIHIFGKTDQTRRSMGTLGPLTCLRANGEEFPAEITISQTEMAGQKIYTAILRDTTKRVRTEAALRESEERLRLFIEHAPVSLAMFDHEMRYLAVSQRWMADYGLGNQDIIGQSHYELFPEISDEWKAFHQRGLAGEIIRTDEDKFERLDGSIQWSRWEVRPWHAADGSIGGIVIFTEDITARKKTEEALRESEEKYRLLFENVMNGFALHEIVLDDDEKPVDYIFLEVNDAFEQTTGLEREKILGKKATHAIPGIENDPADWIGRYGEVTLTGKEIRFEQRSEALGKWYSVLAFRPRKGQFATIFEDITERKEAEHALRKTQEKLLLAIHSANVGLWDWDLRSNDVYYSPEWKYQLGYEDREISNVFSEWESRVHPEDLERAKETINTFLDNPYPNFYNEFRMQHKDGSYRWILAQASLVNDDQGKPVRMIGSHIDITESKQAEEKLHESEKKYRDLINGMNDTVWVIDFDTTILDVNNAASNVLGYTRDELLSMKISDIDVDLTPEQIQNLAGDMPRDEVQMFETWHTTKDGRKVPVEISSSLVSYMGKPVIMSIGRDITERRRAEQEIANLSKFPTENPNPVLRVQSDGQVIYANKASQELLEMWGCKLNEYLPIEFKDLVSELIESKLNKSVDVPCNDKVYAITLVPVAGSSYVNLYGSNVTERKQVEDELHSRVDELSALYQTTLDIINIQDLPDLLNTIVMRAVSLLGGAGGGLYLCNPEQKQVRCVVSYKTPNDYTGTVLAYGEGAAGIVAATGKPLLIDDYPTWKGRAKAFEDAHPFSAVVSVPMLWHGQVTGVIHVLNDTQQHKFTEEDLTLLTSFANQAAVAVENARLFEETQRRLERLSALRRIDQVITSSLDLRVTLNILLGQILQLLDVDAAAALLYQPELQNLEFVAGQGFRTRTLRATNLHLGNGFAGKAALERRVVQVLDLDKLNTGFLRSPEFRNEEFVAYIGVPLIAKGNIIGVLEIYNRQRLDPEGEWMEFLETLAGQAAIAIDNINLFNRLEMSNLELIQAYDATIEGWARALELRDMETEGHSRRVVDMTIELASQLGIEDEQLMHVRQGALLHDIGKMGVPDSILQKSGSLTPEEWQIIHRHPVYANEWLALISYLKPALDIPYCHHEKWDGTGYPRGLKGEQIPLAARIFAVVDVWDALRSDRPYRDKWSKKKTLEYIKEQSGKHFDPEVVEAFLSMIENE